MKLVFHAALACVLLLSLGSFPGWFDSGEFSTVVGVLGVSHPGGHALYVLLARLFALIPLGSLDFRTSLFSVFGTLAASWILWTLAVKASSSRSSWIGAAVSLGFVLHPSVMLQTVRTEVYALQAALSLACVLLTVAWLRTRDVRFGLSLALSLGAVTALHPLLALTLSPLLLFAVSARVPYPASKFAKWIPFLFLGTALNLYVPLRALRNPIVNWDAPVSWKAFAAFGSARDYSHFMRSPLGLPTGLSSLLFGPEGIWPLSLLLLALLGVFLLFRTRRRETVLFSVMLGLTALPLFRGDFQLRNPDVHAYLMVPVALSLLLAALGAEACAPWLRVPEKGRRFFAFALTSFTLIWILPTGWRALHAGVSDEAEALASHLDAAPVSSAVVVESDHWLFPLWYRTYIERRRPDVAVISPLLLKARWYRERVLERYGILFERKLFREYALDSDIYSFGLLASSEPTGQNPAAEFLAVCRERLTNPDPFQIRQFVCSHAVMTAARQEVRMKQAIRAVRMLETVLSVPASRKPCDRPEEIRLPFPLVARSSVFLTDPESLEDTLGLLYLGCRDWGALTGLAAGREQRNVNVRLMHSFALARRG
ncbi:MAG: DUF2723 domain-containing protein [Pseudomonadota bacterium]